MKRIASAGPDAARASVGRSSSGRLSLLFGLAAVGLIPVACGGGTGGTGQSTGGAGANSSGGAGGKATATGGSGGASNATGGTTGGAAGAAGGRGGAAGGTIGSGGAGGHAGSGGTGTGTGGAAGKPGSGGAAGGTAGTGGTSTCTIGGVVYPNGAVDPANACLKCASTQTTTAWSPVTGGTSCGTGQACFAGTCLRTCTLTNGAVYGAGQMGGCAVCNPDVSTTTLTPVTEGSTCVAGSTGGTAAVCHVGACVHGCFIGGAFVGDGADNAANVCQYCDPTTSLNAWTSRPNCGGSCPAPAIAPTLFTYTNPPPGEIVYDTLRGEVVAFSPTTTVQAGGTSIWDGATWVQLNSNAMPSAAVSLGLLPPPIYDSVRDRAVAFGGTGTSTGTYTNATWEWDEQSWMSVTPSDLIPRTRIGHAMVFDASLGRTVIFGGSSRDGTVSTLTDTWAWDGASWTRLVPSTSAAPPDVGPMAYDSGRTRSVLLVGGTTLNAGSMQYTLPLSTWELAGSTWSQVRTDNLTIYSQIWSAVTAYDSSRQHVVRLFQRTATINAPASVTMDEWNGSIWTSVPTPAFQIPVGVGNPVYDSARRRLVFKANSTTGNGLTSMYEIGFEPLPDRAPTVSAIPAQIVFAHDTLTVTAQASDPDQNPVTFSATGLPSGASMTTGGVFTFTPTESQTGGTTVSVTASDGCLTGSTTFNITVYWITYPFPQGALSVTGPLTLPVVINGASATWTGNALYTCTVSGTNPGKLTLACVGTGSTLTSAGSTVSFAPPNIQTPILPDLSYSYAQAGTTMAGRLERLSDGTYLVHVTKYSAPGPQSQQVVESGADATADLQ